MVQRSLRYESQIYTYYKDDFKVRGCGPSSVANALTVVFGIQEQTYTDQLLREIMRLMCYNHTPYESPISSDGIRFFQSFDEGQYPLMAKIRERYDGAWYASMDLIDPAELTAYLEKEREKEHQAFYGGCFALRGNWDVIARLARDLTDRGMGDCILALCLLSGGTEGTAAPFRLGDGHYETICLLCEEISKDTSLYIIDSAPRALPWEDKIPGNYYDTYFLDISGEPLKETFEIERINPSVIRLRIRRELQEEKMKVLQTDGAEEAEALEKQWLEKLLFYGTGNLMVHLP